MSISKTEIESFRVGNFEDASEDIKKKWYVTMLKFMPPVSKKYNTPELRASDHVSTLTTASDEAYLLWLLSIYSSKWSISQVDSCEEDDEKYDSEEETTPGPKKKKQKTSGKHVSRTHQELFRHLYNIVVKAREEDKLRGSNSWDEALHNEAKQQFEKGPKAVQGGVDENVASHSKNKIESTIYVERYSPGKPMRYVTFTESVAV